MLTRDNAHADDGLRRADRAGDPGRDRRPLGAAPAARGRRGRRHPDPAPRRHRQRRAAHPADRSALGDRSARPAPARPARRASSPAARPGGEAASTSPTSCSRSSTASTRPRSPSLVRRPRRPGRRRLLRRRRCERFALLAERAAAAARRTSASRCSTSSAGSSTPPASTSSWPPSVTPGRGRAARQPRPVRAGGRRVPGRRRRRHACRRCWPTSPPRTTSGQRPRRRHPDRGRLGQAAHRPPRQGPRVGRGLPGRGVRAASSRPTARRTLWTSVPCVLPAPLRGDARDLPAAGRAHDRRPRRLPRRRPRRTRPIEELRLGYVAFTRAAHRARRCRRTAGPPTARPRSARRPTSAPSARRCASRGAEPPEQWLDKPAKGDAQPLRRRRRPTGPGRSRTGTAGGRRAGSAAAALVRAVEPDGGRRRPRACSRPSAGRRVGRRDRAAARRGARATGADDRACRCRRSLSATALARLRDDPETFARDLARPMPRPPSPAARFGTRFHAWVEARFGQQLLLDPDDLPGRGDAGIDDDADLRELVAAVRERPVRRPGPARRRAAVRAGARRPGGPRPDRRGLRRPGRRRDGFLRRRLEDQPARRPPTRSSSRSTGVAWAELHRGAGRAGARGVLLRPHRRPRRARRAARAGAELEAPADAEDLESERQDHGQLDHQVDDDHEGGPATWPGTASAPPDRARCPVAAPGAGCSPR